MSDELINRKVSMEEISILFTVEQKIQQKILEIQEGFMRWDAATAVRMQYKMNGLAEALEIVRLAKNAKEAAE